jgi:protein-S-isoprenylcysteine O-methyltransferase Ste14
MNNIGNPMPTVEQVVTPPALEEPSRQPHSFALLSRVAASLWFVILSIVFARGLIATITAVPPGSLTFSDWSPVVSHICSLIFFVTLGWLMLVRPRARARQNGVVPQIVAFTGTYAVWLMPILPQGVHPPALQMVSAAITLTGSLMIVCSVFYLGRSFSIAPQARKLVIGGPYRIVRHPLYVAEEIAIIGVALQYAWYAALPFLVCHVALQLRRMDYEESLLRAVFPDYEAYARRTARLIPGIW